MTKEDTVKFIKSGTMSTPPVNVSFEKFELTYLVALTEAIKWDGSSGGVIRMVVLTKDGVERLIFYPDEYQKD
jgi:hypothetical protein